MEDAMIKIDDEDFILLMLCSGGVAGAMVYCARGCFCAALNYYSQLDKEPKPI